MAVCTAGLRDRALAAFGVAHGREEAERRGLPFRATVTETVWGEPTGNEPGLECLSDSDAGSDDEEGPTRNNLVGWGLDEVQEKSRREWRVRKLQELVRQGGPKVVTFQERDGGPSRLGVNSWESGTL